MSENHDSDHQTKTIQRKEASKSAVSSLRKFPDTLSRRQSSNTRTPLSSVPDPLANSRYMFSLLEVDSNLDLATILPGNGRDFGTRNSRLFEPAIIPAIAIVPLLQDTVLWRTVIEAKTDARFGIVELGASERGAGCG